MDQKIMLDLCSFTACICMLYEWKKCYGEMASRAFKIRLNISCGLIFSALVLLGYLVHEMNYSRVTGKFVFFVYFFVWGILFPIAVLYGNRIKILNAEYRKKYKGMDLPRDYRRWVDFGKISAVPIVLWIVFLLILVLYELSVEDSMIMKSWNKPL